jgi:putative SbcD/Mre11-related phosphoesterase
MPDSWKDNMLVHGDWLLTPERAAVHLPTATAVIADLHLGYDRVRCRMGEAVPTVSLDDALSAITALQQAYQVRRLVIAGDLFEDARICAEWPDFVKWLKGSGMELAGIVPGNHDHGFPDLELAVPVCRKGLFLGAWHVTHGDGELNGKHRLVHGHFHPCFRWSGGVSAPCYLIAPQRIILPAYSEDAAGVNVLRQPTWRNYRCLVIAGNEVLDFGRLADLQRAVRALK